MSVIEVLQANKILFASIGVDYALRCIMLHGSASRGEERMNSDIDIALLPGARVVTYEDEAVILQRLVHLVPERKLDVHVVDTYKSSALLFYEVMQGLVLYEDEAGQAERLALYAWKLNIEAQPLREKRFAVASRWLAQTTSV
jgi:predicted nucleotidyltransferase